MEDRNGVRTCVTCELFAERTREGSRLVAEVPLGWFFRQVIRSLYLSGSYYSRYIDHGSSYGQIILELFHFRYHIGWNFARK